MARSTDKQFFKRYIPVQYLRWGVIIFIFIMFACYGGVKLEQWIDGSPPIPPAEPVWSRKKRASLQTDHIEMMNLEAIPQTPKENMNNHRSGGDDKKDIVLGYIMKALATPIHTIAIPPKE